MMDWTNRTALLLGEEAVQKLQRSHVLVLGIGGVGGEAAIMLARAGVGHLTLIDGDTVDPSNLNRQAVAYRHSVGMLKTDALAAILRDIAPEMTLTLVSRYVSAEDAETLLLPVPDFAVDAIDDVAAKTAFLLAAKNRGIPLISAMGAGGRLDPSQIRECDISKTCQCGLARAVRSRLREAGVHSGIRVVFSPEVPVKTSPVGTVSYMPNLFGCFCAAAAIRYLTGK